MGHIIFSFDKWDKPKFFIERRVDNHESQRLNFRHAKESWITTETGNYISIYGRDEDGNLIQAELPISVDELLKALQEYKKGH